MRSHGVIRRRKFLLPQKFGADFPEGLLRSKILFAHDEHNALHKSKGVVKHEGFQLTVIRSTPERSFQEGPANLHFTFGGIEIAVSGAANHSAGGPLDDGEGAFRFDGSIEESLKDLRLVAVVFRMLLPDPP